MGKAVVKGAIERKAGHLYYVDGEGHVWETKMARGGKRKKGKKKSGKIVIEHAVTRKPGYLYYIDAEGNIREAKMARGGRKKKKKK